MSLPKMLSIRSADILPPFKERAVVVTGADSSGLESGWDMSGYTVAAGALSASSMSDVSGSGSSVYTGLER